MLSFIILFLFVFRKGLSVAQARQQIFHLSLSSQDDVMQVSYYRRLNDPAPNP